MLRFLFISFCPSGIPQQIIALKSTDYLSYGYQFGLITVICFFPFLGIAFYSWFNVALLLQSNLRVTKV